MAKYHITAKGNPGICRAKHKCPLGDMETEHYASREQAEKAAQAKMMKEYGSPMQGLKKLKAQDELKKLSERGASIETITSVRTHKFNKLDSDISSIAVLDEKPSPAFLQSVRKGAYAKDFSKNS